MLNPDNMPEVLMDRMAVNTLAIARPDVLEILRKHGLGKTERKDTVHYCGLVQGQDGPPIFFLPRQTNASTHSNALASARMTMNALARYGREVESRRGVSRSLEDNAMLIALVYELAEDFRHNGIYSERLRFSSRNNGKPDWSRTLGRELPFITEEAEPVFSTIRTRKALDAHENPLSQIQAVILREIFRRHSWWLGGISSRIGELNHYPAPHSRRSQWTRILRSYRQNLYANRALFLIEALCDYLDNSAGQKDGAFLYGVEDFQTVWEHMLRKVLPFVESGWNSLLVKPGYIHASDNSVLLKDGMETDIVVSVGNKLKVVDAKYYEGTGPNSLPSWPDLVKQIYYDAAIRIAAPTKTVSNCLVFPTNGLQMPCYVSAGLFHPDKSATAEFPRIDIYYADTKRVLQAYIFRRRDGLGII